MIFGIAGRSFSAAAKLLVVPAVSGTRGKLRVTGAKATDKTYYRHSTYPGGIYETNFLKMQQRFPGRALEKAVKGMLPKGPLGYAMIKKLKVYAEATHPHAAQQPKALEL